MTNKDDDGDSLAGLAVCHCAAGSEAGSGVCYINAYHYMVEDGFRADIQGVAMHRPDEPGYNRSDVYLIDDWR
jgi:hypothetical protein